MPIADNYYGFEAKFDPETYAKVAASQKKFGHGLDTESRLNMRTDATDLEKIQASEWFKNLSDEDKGKVIDHALDYERPEGAKMFAPKDGFFNKLVDLTPQYVRDHPWAVGLGTVATVGALIAAYALWKKKKGQTNAVTEEMCVLYPLLDKYSKSLSESYSFDNYNSYINASKRMDKIAPVVYDMMLREDNNVHFGPNPDLAKLAAAGYGPAGQDQTFNSDYNPYDSDAGQLAAAGFNRDGGATDATSDASIIAEILEWLKKTGNKTVEAFLDTYNITADWVKAHPGMAGAAALAAILGTYGVYKLIKIYKEAKENGEVDAKELEESIDMLRKFRTVCESSCNPYITETQKYKNITLLCNLIDSDL